MSIRQQILQWIYPALMKTGKVFGAREKVLANVNSIQPFRSLFGYTITLNDGTSLPLQSLKGKKILLVNTASDVAIQRNMRHCSNCMTGIQTNLWSSPFLQMILKSRRVATMLPLHHFVKRIMVSVFHWPGKLVLLKVQSRSRCFSGCLTVISMAGAISNPNGIFQNTL
jgi:hypothetical protein